MALPKTPITSVIKFSRTRWFTGDNIYLNLNFYNNQYFIYIGTEYLIHMEQELPTLPGHLSSPFVFIGVHVAQSV